MASGAALEAKIKQIDEWESLLKLWKRIESDDERLAAEWNDKGRALENVILRAFELDESEKVRVRYPYNVKLMEEEVEQIDGAIHLEGLTCLVECKNQKDNVSPDPIAKMRNQLIRRPAGTIGVIFSRTGFTSAATILAQFAMPQAVLLWTGPEISFAMDEGMVSVFLRRKYQACCEMGMPDYNIQESSIP